MIFARRFLWEKEFRMQAKKQIEKIKEHLNNSSNPIFFFDNDADGLCSFLLLQRYLKKGKGVPVRSFPDLTKEYFKKVIEFKADSIFILDKPSVSAEFFEEARQINIPVVWIDHHEIDKKEIPEFVDYYNPLFNKKSENIPVTALCYRVTEKKEDIWLAVVGCISDKFVPDFYSEFEKIYPDISVSFEDAFDVYYKSQIGKIARIFNFALKDRTANVMNMIRFLIKARTPYEVLEENTKNKTMHDRFSEIEKKKNKFLEKAVNLGKFSERFLYFQYGGELSISSDIANELSYVFPDKVIIVVYISGAKANISVRGENVRKKVLEAIQCIEGATGGGHECAVGAQVFIGDLENFKNKLLNLL
ncbi:MAG: DHH family phosphoesterase [archaeon]